MVYNTILWPTDLSATSLKAGSHVVSLAQKYNAAVVLLYVAVDLCEMFPAYGNYPSLEHLNDFRDWEVGKARQRLEQLCAEDLKACPFIRIRLAMGDPAEQILKTAKAENADMIVMTGRGQGFKDQSDRQLGQIAERVAKKADIPLLVVQP